MGNIILLDDLTINKIAAGEVIERPASVVKEVVENSIDAGATKITIEVKNGGINKIKILDNGCGIKPDDMDYAFERHATSKIRQADDLQEVKSMGFRGEALASIAAISNVEMISKAKDQTTGNRIILKAGDIIKKEETGAQDGTSITISNLFFNTPVRYKFLKKDYTELGYIEDAVTRIALANPNIAIKLSNENKTIIQTTGNGDIKSVIYSIYGKDVSDGIVKVDYEYDGIKISGVVGKPEIARNNRTHQIFFVNKRYIKDKTLSAAAEQAFKGLLQIGKYGFLILNLDIDPGLIDVNVHPSKLEIRFQDEQRVFKAVYHSIKESLLRSDLVTNTEKQNEEKEEEIRNEAEVKVEEKTSAFKNLFKKKELNKKQEEINFNNSEEEIKSNTIAELYTERNKVENEDINVQNNMEETKVLETISSQQKDISENFDKMYERTFGSVKKEDTDNYNVESIDVQKAKKVENISIFEEKEAYLNTPNYKYIGILFSTYIVIEMGQEIYIIDQHAAHERVMYEKIKENFYNNSKKDSQIMLLPDIISLTHKEKEIVKENAELFSKAGFTFEEFGDNTIRLIGVPNICMELDTKELFLEILDEINTVAITAKQEKEDKFIATIACKAAVKANMALTKEEVDNLMSKLLLLPNPFTCPHGRPTAIRMSKADIEKKFGRR